MKEVWRTKQTESPTCKPLQKKRIPNACEKWDALSITAAARCHHLVYAVAFEAFSAKHMFFFLAPQRQRITASNGRPEVQRNKECACSKSKSVRWHDYFFNGVEIHQTSCIPSAKPRVLKYTTMSDARNWNQAMKLLVCRIKQAIIPAHHPELIRVIAGAAASPVPWQHRTLERCEFVRIGLLRLLMKCLLISNYLKCIVSF